MERIRVFFFAPQLCDLATLAIIHTRRQPNLATDQRGHQTFSSILLCFGHLQTQSLNMVTFMFFSSECGELKHIQKESCDNFKKKHRVPQMRNFAPKKFSFQETHIKEPIDNIFLYVNCRYFDCPQNTIISCLTFQNKWELSHKLVSTIPYQKAMFKKIKFDIRHCNLLPELIRFDCRNPTKLY